MNEELQKLVSAGKLTEKAGEKLSSLEAGVFCLHKSWGVGKVAEWDLLGDRILIDFEDKPGHAMKLEFAAKSLDAIADTHILAKFLANPEEMQAVAKDQAPVVVKEVLQCYGGSLSLDKFEEIIKGRFVTDAKYKSWWDATKKLLRKETQFIVPSKRNVPLELREEDLSPAQALVQDFVSARELKVKIKALEALIKDPEKFENPGEELKPVIDHLNETASSGIKITTQAPPAMDLFLLQEDLFSEFKDKGIEDLRIGQPIGDVVRGQESKLGEIISGLTFSRQKRLLEFFPDAFGERWPEVMLDNINSSGLRTIGEMAKFLDGQGESEKLISHLKKGLSDRTLSTECLTWICKERNKLAKGLFSIQLAPVISSSLERHHMDETVRKTDRLQEIVMNDKDLLPDLVRDGEMASVKVVARWLLSTPVFDELTRKSLLARVIKTHPEIEQLTIGKDEEEQIEKAKEEIIVSIESYQEREKDYKRLTQVEIPKNREDIKIAREYGDLRENFEYKAAKEQQRVLNKREEDMKRDLATATPTDFTDADPSAVNIGTVVDLEIDGVPETLTVLGAWDSDVENGVISYLTDVAQLLLGKVVGDEVELPASQIGQSRAAKVLAIRKYAD